MPNWTGEINSNISPAIDYSNLSAKLQLLPSALLFCVDVTGNVIHQISRMSLIFANAHNQMAWNNQSLDNYTDAGEVPFAYVLWLQVSFWQFPQIIHWDNNGQKGIQAPLLTIPYGMNIPYLTCWISLSPSGATMYYRPFWSWQTFPL